MKSTHFQAHEINSHKLFYQQTALIVSFFLFLILFARRTGCFFCVWIMKKNTAERSLLCKHLLQNSKMINRRNFVSLTIKWIHLNQLFTENGIDCIAFSFSFSYNFCALRFVRNRLLSFDGWQIFTWKNTWNFTSKCVWIKSWYFHATRNNCSFSKGKWNFIVKEFVLFFFNCEIVCYRYLSMIEIYHA